METPIRFRWSALIALGVWALMLSCYELGMVRWEDFTFVHTLIPSLVLLVALAPLSARRIVSTRLLLPGMATWAGAVVPLTYLACRYATGLGEHCDRAFVVAGGTIFLVIMLAWMAGRFRAIWSPQAA